MKMKFALADAPRSRPAHWARLLSLTLIAGGILLTAAVGQITPGNLPKEAVRPVPPVPPAPSAPAQKPAMTDMLPGWDKSKPEAPGTEGVNQQMLKIIVEQQNQIERLEKKLDALQQQVEALQKKQKDNP